MTRREQVISELRWILHDVGLERMTDDELEALLRIMRPAGARLIPDNVFHLRPRVRRNQTF